MSAGFDALSVNVLRAILAGVAYTNVHTTTFPGGEIRGQISR